MSAARARRRLTRHAGIMAWVVDKEGRRRTLALNLATSLSVHAKTGATAQHCAPPSMHALHSPAAVSDERYTQTDEGKVKSKASLEAYAQVGKEKEAGTLTIRVADSVRRRGQFALEDPGREVLRRCRGWQLAASGFVGDDKSDLHHQVWTALSTLQTEPRPCQRVQQEQEGESDPPFVAPPSLVTNDELEDREWVQHSSVSAPQRAHPPVARRLTNDKLVRSVCRGAGLEACRHHRHNSPGFSYTPRLVDGVGGKGEVERGRRCLCLLVVVVLAAIVGQGRHSLRDIDMGLAGGAGLRRGRRRCDAPHSLGLPMSSPLIRLPPLRCFSCPLPAPSAAQEVTQGDALPLGTLLALVGLILVSASPFVALDLAGKHGREERRVLLALR